MHSDCGGYIQYLMNIRVGVHFEIPRLTMACRVGGSTEHTTNGSDQTTKRPSWKIYNTTFTVTCVRRLSWSGDIHIKLFLSVPICYPTHYTIQQSTWKKFFKGPSFCLSMERIRKFCWFHGFISQQLRLLFMLIKIIWLYLSNWSWPSHSRP